MIGWMDGWMDGMKDEVTIFTRDYIICLSIHHSQMREQIENILKD